MHTRACMRSGMCVGGSYARARARILHACTYTRNDGASFFFRRFTERHTRGGSPISSLSPPRSPVPSSLSLALARSFEIRTSKLRSIILQERSGAQWRRQHEDVVELARTGFVPETVGERSRAIYRDSKCTKLSFRNEVGNAAAPPIKIAANCDVHQSPCGTDLIAVGLILPLFSPSLISSSQNQELLSGVYNEFLRRKA